MLLTLMYHRIGKGKHANALPLFRAHLNYIKEHYNVALPGEPLTNRSVCLTFDDATYDFYHYIYPLLQKLQLRAVLGVPVRYILDTTTLSPEKRLEVPYTLAMQDEIFEESAPFCTWEELREMVASGHVEVACHSYSHSNLTFPFVDLTQEIVTAKEILRTHLPQTISTFIYPFGRTSKKAHALVSTHYPYSFRIGSAANFSWNASKKPLCRIPADHLTSPTTPLTFKNRLFYYLKSFVRGDFLSSLSVRS